MPHPLPRCRIIPLPDHQASVEIDGVERLRWHFAGHYPRPFFYPLIGPAGHTLTRMGHPGAQNHDHHRSVWFAHEKVVGINFWADNTPARIRQKHWLVYDDGDAEAALAVQLGWYDGHDPQELLEQELIARVVPLEMPATGGHVEFALDLQATFIPKAAVLEFGRTNFGFLAVRVAKSLSAFFGGGRLTNSRGGVGEPALFGQPAEWVDYSGPVPSPKPKPDAEIIEGITYLDHPQNPGYPNRWHVRDDGWMGCAPGMQTPLTTTREAPLRFRFLLYVHRGPADPAKIEPVARDFVARPNLRIRPSPGKNRQFGLEHLPS